MFTRSVAVVIARPMDGKGSSVHFSVTGRPAGLLRLMQPGIARGV